MAKVIGVMVVTARRLVPRRSYVRVGLVDGGDPSPCQTVWLADRLSHGDTHGVPDDEVTTNDGQECLSHDSLRE
jgi:hypothetical protein